MSAEFHEMLKETLDRMSKKIEVESAAMVEAGALLSPPRYSGGRRLGNLRGTRGVLIWFPVIFLNAQKAVQLCW